MAKNSALQSKATDILNKYGVKDPFSEDDDIGPVKDTEEKSIFSDILFGLGTGALVGSNYAATGTLTDKTIAQAERTIDNIAPVREDRGWLDGYLKKGNDSAAKTILGTSADLTTDIGAGFLGVGETITDADAAVLGKIAPTISDTEFYQNGMFTLESENLHKQNTQQASEATRNAVNAFVAKDLYDEQETSKGLLASMIANQDLTGKLQNGYVAAEADRNNVQQIQKTIRNYLDNDMEDDSVLDEKLDGVAQSFGQRLATIGLGAFGVPWELVTGLTAAGSKAEESVRNGDNDLQTLWKMGTSAANEIIPEYFFGGSGLGEKGLFNLDVLTRGISNRVVKTIADYLVDMGAEGVEEVTTDVLNNIADGLANGENIWNVLTSDEALHGYVDSFIAGSSMSGLSNAMNLGNHLYTKTDYRSDFSANEQKVYDRLLEDAIAEESKEGKLSGKRRSELAAEISEKMEKGYISTDLIEEVLGGEQYDRYRKAKSWEESLQKEYDALKQEYDALYDMEGGKKSSRMNDREAELKQKLPQLKKQLENVKNTSSLASMKAQMTNDVYQSTKSDARLRESFFERVRRTQAYRNDGMQYDEKQRQTIQKAIDSGILNNTRKTHDFVDLLARISADKGIVFDFTDNERLKDSPFALEGKNVNGFMTKDGITLNINSHNTLNAVVGHEVTHVLEGTEFYNELQQAVFDYARAKGELGSRWSSLKERYKGVDADINAELTADLVGDYLFTDANFLAKLSADNRSVFEQVFGEIKYLCRAATAGSREARKLEKVKKAFEDAYRAETKSTATEDGVKYSIYSRPNFTKAEWAIVDRRKHSEFDDPQYDLDENKKWMYANEKGSTVFAVYSKHDADDPTVLYGSRGKKAEADYATVNAYLRGELNVKRSGVNTNRKSINAVLADLNSTWRNENVGLSSATRRQSAADDVQFPLGESGSNGRGDYGNGGENLRDAGLTEDNGGATGIPVAPVTFSNDYATIRSFMKENDEGEDTAPIGSYVKYSLSDMDDIGPGNEAISRNAANKNNPSPEQTHDNGYLKVLEQLHAEIAMEEEIRKYNERAALEWLALERENARVREEFEDADRAAEQRLQGEQTAQAGKIGGRNYFTREQIGRSVGAKAKNYKAYNPITGEYMPLTEGSRITQPKNHVMAGKGRNRQIDELQFLVDKYGGNPLEWTKEKGFGYVDDEYSESHYVELHWYQEPTIDGKVKMKIKVQPDGRIYLDED